MKERPILFNAEMVRAILEGRKTQARRIVKHGKDKDFECELAPNEIAGEINSGDFTNSKVGKPSDQLWVRETFAASEYMGCRYKADGQQYQITNGVEQKHIPINIKWTPSIHMPRWASRIQLEITNVRVERLHDISEEDAKAEGFDLPSAEGMGWKFKARHNFRHTWDSIYKNWDSNPWVWVIEFKILEKSK